MLVVPSKLGAGTTVLKTYIFTKHDKTGMYTNSGNFVATINIDKILPDKTLDITLNEIEELVKIYNETSSRTGLIQEYTNAMIRVQKTYESIDNQISKIQDESILKIYPDILGVINAIGCFVIPGLSNGVINNRASVKKLIESLKLNK